ncbi:MFS general substrate transporter [Hesseltinella vesiculosa]|uniref:MFS general substrate transporter n=1 Tax=Hesseltinella vesiculosa TaxID=101127 RepID=A0A1X2GEG6_9FUNG|nr:MFS general substrate transporter [Hesseltinella vesiculosa]
MSSLQKETSYDEDVKAKVEEVDLESKQIIKHGHVAFEYSPAEKQLKRKIDIAFLPLIVFILFIQFVDKTALNNANMLGVKKDTGLDTDKFGWLGALFYIGYLAGQVPNNFLVQRLPISKYMGVVLLLWGTTFMATAAAKSFPGLAVSRVVLGLFEATTYPCVFILISMFYRRHEQVFYISYMFLANACAVMVGALIAFAIGGLQGVNGLSAWQYLYLIWGSVTFFLGILFFVFLPDRPESRWFKLTEDEKLIVAERLKDNGQKENTTFNKAHIHEALREGRYYAICAISFFCNLQNGCTTTFSTQIINEMGFSTLQSILLNIANGATGVLLISITMFASRRYNEICYVGMGMVVVAFLGVLLLTVIPSGPVRLLGIFLTYGVTPVYILAQTLINNNVKGFSKKAFYTSSQLVSYSLGNFLGPLFIQANTAPRYLPAMITYDIANVIQLFAFIYIRWSLVRDQRRRSNTAIPGQHDSINDLTDKEDLTFAYRQ